MKCKTMLVHEEVVASIRDSLIEQEALEQTAGLLKMFSDPTRLKILQALSMHELCVCDLAMIIESSQSAVSHQLAQLKQARLVKFRREGKVVFYSLDDDHVQKIMDFAIEHIKHQ